MNATRALFRRRVLTAVLTAAVTAGGSPRMAAAQERTSLEEYQLEYESALSNYRGAVAAREAVLSRFDRLKNDFLDARRRGDNANYGALMEANGELKRMRRRVEATLQQLEEAGGAFLAALDTRREELTTRAENLPQDSTEQADELTILLVDLTNQIDEVDGQLTRARSPLAPSVPETMSIDPGDTQEDLRLKVQILEGRAAQYDSTLVELDGRLHELEERQRTDRRVLDVLAPLDRFDERQLPVVPRRFQGAQGGEEGAEGEASDTTGASPRGMTLEERIGNLQSLRERLVQYRDAVQQQAGFIRRRINQGGPESRFA